MSAKQWCLTSTFSLTNQITGWVVIEKRVCTVPGGKKTQPNKPGDGMDTVNYRKRETPLRSFSGHPYRLREKADSKMKETENNATNNVFVCLCGTVSSPDVEIALWPWMIMHVISADQHYSKVNCGRWPGRTEWIQTDVLGTRRRGKHIRNLKKKDFCLVNLFFVVWCAT